MKTHPAVGGRLLASHPLAGLAIEAVTAHHERPDGRGYPFGLGGRVVPRVARIVGIADAFDAMTSQRPYRSAMPIERALSEIAAGSGGQFDAGLAEAFLRLGQSGALKHVSGHCEPGLPLRACPACGGPMVVRKRQRAGDFVFCRVCGAESRLRRETQGLGLEASRERAEPADLAPNADPDLIGGLVDQTAPHLL